MASERPSSALGVPVTGSVQPRMSLTMAPGPTPSAASGTKATGSTDEQSKGPVAPSVHGVSAPTTASNVRHELGQGSTLDPGRCHHA